MTFKNNIRQTLLGIMLNSEAVQKYCKSSHPLDLNKVLILDETTVEYLKELFKPSELTELGYLSTQGIKTQLQPASVHLIYCITPTEPNFIILRNLLSQQPFHFKTIHVYCCGQISNDLINLIKTDTKSIKYLVTLKEILLDFSVVSNDTFLFGRDFTIPDLYFNFNPPNDPKITEISTMLTNLFRIMNDKPGIRYYKGSKYTAGVAEIVKNSLDLIGQKMPNFGIVDQEKRQSICLIFDRNYDTLVPFTHDLTFQAMIHDLLEVKGGNTVEVFEGGQLFKYTMNDDDALWNELRHQHIANILTKVSINLKEFTEKNNIKVPDGNANVSALRKIISKFPAVMPEFSKLQALFVIASKLMSIYKERNLKEIISTEQDFASNMKADGEPVSDNFAIYYTLMDDIQSNDDKLRLISLFSLKNNNGLSLALVEKLLKMAHVDSAKSFIDGFKKMGFYMVDEGGVRKDPIQRVLEDSDIAIGYDDSRFVPQIWGVLRRLVDRSLSEAEYPFMGEAVSLSVVEEEQKKNFEFGKYSKKPDPKPKKNKPRVYLVFIGGVCHSELRCIQVAQKVFSNYEFIVGTSEVFNSKSFMGHFRSLKT